MNVFTTLPGGLQGQLAADIARLTAGALVAGLWQGVLLSVAAGLVLRIMPKSTATMRFAVWATVFGVSVTLPFVDLPGGAFAAHASAATGSHVVFDLRWSYLLTGVWLFASAYRLIELGLQAASLRTLWRGAVSVPGEKQVELGMALSVRGRRVELCTSDEVDRPSVIGFFAPRILIPTWLFEQLTAMELNHIVLHEMEHLRRRDDWVNLLQKVGLVLLPLNPALFWIDRRLSTERELACDDGVLERTNTPRAYAASLASVAERRLYARNGRIGMLTLAVTGLRRRSELGRRIESILGMRSPLNRRATGAVAMLLVAGVVGSAAELSRAPQLVTFGRNEVVAQTAAQSPRGEVGLASPTTVGRSAARYQDVIFHAPAKARVVKARSVAVAAPTHEVRSVPVAEKVVSTAHAAAPARRQFVVLTSWEEDQSVARVAVATPDGKSVCVPYAAVPTEAGWLLVQL